MVYLGLAAISLAVWHFADPRFGIAGCACSNMQA